LAVRQRGDFDVEKVAANQLPEPTPIGKVSPHSRATSLYSARLSFDR